MSPAVEARLQRALDRTRRATGSPGAQATVVLPDGSVWSGASGLADVEGDTPVTVDTRFAMGSMMKLHSAVLVLDLVEEGALSLDDSLTEWLPDFPGAQRITIRQLLLHTSGLAQVAGSEIDEALDADPDHHLSYEQLVLKPVCAPGTCYHYQSPDYELIGEVVERATGNSFAHEMRTRIWDPLGLDETYFPSQEQAAGPFATGYGAGSPASAEEVATCEDPDVDNPYPCAGGGLLSTTEDVAGLGHAVLSGRVLESTSLEQLLDFEATRGLPGISECGAVGLGLVRAGSPELGERWSHGGFTGNFHSSAPYYPRFGVMVAVVVNDGGDIGPIEEALSEAILDDAEVVDPRAGTGFCNYDIYVTRNDGDRRTRLTRHPGLDGSTVAWSPGGNRLAFGTTRTGDPEIFVMSSDGTRQRNITRHPADDVGASWSPGGDRIAFHSNRDGTNDIYVMNADGSGVVQLTQGPSDDVIPSWSLDGSEIAYASGEGDDHDIYVMNADGSDERRLVAGDDDQWWPTWAPGGRRIAFVADRKAVGGGGINVVDVVTRALSVVDVPVDGPNFPSWGPDGRLALVDLPGEIWTVSPDGSALRRITETAEREFQPAWSPDGRWLAFPGERWVEN